MSPAVLKDFQLELGGVVIGHGTWVPIAEIEGLGRAPVRGDVVPRPGADGAWAGIEALASGRAIHAG